VYNIAFGCGIIGFYYLVTVNNSRCADNTNLFTLPYLKRNTVKSIKILCFIFFGGVNNFLGKELELSGKRGRFFKIMPYSLI
jgi:hypothetical protein